MIGSNARPVVSFITLATALCALEFWATQWLDRTPRPDLVALAVTADLVVGLPLLFGALVVRQLRLPWVTLAPVVVVGAIVAFRLLPPEQRTLLDMFARVLPLIEITLLGYAAVRLRRVWREYRKVRPTTVYASDALEAAVGRCFGHSPFTFVLVAELLLVGLAVGGWFVRFRSNRAGLLLFSIHRSGIYPAFLFVIVLLVVGETLAAHLIVTHFWNATAAWVLTALSGYSLLWILGDFHALRLHPLVIDGNTLHLRRGLLWRGTVALDSIQGVRRVLSSDTRHKGFVSLAPVGQGDIVLVLREPTTIYGLLGMQRQVTRFGIAVDNQPTLLAAIGA